MKCNFFQIIFRCCECVFLLKEKFAIQVIDPIVSNKLISF